MSPRATAFVALQHLLPQHALSRAVHRLARLQQPLLKNGLIRAFLRGYRPDMSEAAVADPYAYPSFNAFFTRSLRAGARLASSDPGLLDSPVDGTVSQLGRIAGTTLVQAKGQTYTLEELLGGRTQWSRRFAGGTFATLYLAPYNYHRIHMPIAGALRASWLLPGRLFSVNGLTAARLPKLFCVNERVVCVFESGPLLFAVVLVGALFVGSIETIWHGEITPGRARGSMDLPLTGAHAPLEIAKGAELGRFNMGSTVILLLAPGAAAFLPGHEPGGTVRVGQPLARLAALPVPSSAAAP